MCQAGIQIEITNHCHNKCSNCTRLVGHHKKPYFMEVAYFKSCVDSMYGGGKGSKTYWPGIVGFLGGEPLLHPEFTKLCEYAAGKFPKEQLGLWTCMPTGFEHYREVICNTFAHIFINDHTRTDVLHTPILVHPSSIGLEPWQVSYVQDKCWVQNSWSATMNTRGAFFCEVAGALCMLTGEGRGWKVEPGWWQKSPRHFTTQIDKFCSMCGAAFPMIRRESVQGIDDVCPWWEGRLKALGSPKYKAGRTTAANLTLTQDTRQTATYKDMDYREGVARRYGIFLLTNAQGYCQPYLRKAWDKAKEEQRQSVPLLSRLKGDY
jgi:hypothetical protein